jgi:hypothetical protein
VQAFFQEDGHLAAMSNRVLTSQWQSVNHQDLDLAHMSLRNFKLLSMTDWENTYWSILWRTVECAYHRPVEAYTTFVLLYNVPSRWTHDKFRSFVDPANVVAQILLAHFIAIQATLTPILALERVGFQGVHAPTATLSWIDGIYKNMTPSFRHYLEWPRQVARWPYSRFIGQKDTEFYE